MSNSFLQDFVQLMVRFTPNEAGMRMVSEQAAEKELEVLRAIMEKVKLKKDNYVSLMNGLKIFIDCHTTQKQAYKLLAKIIEKYELQNVTGLIQI
jgi:hypothetical protein